MNREFWQGRRVLLTGHTGFKGGWLAIMLNMLGAEVHAFALPPESSPAFYHDARLDTLVKSSLGDIRDSKLLARCIAEAKPEIILHLAAQAIVSTSFERPLFTLQTNIMGTAHLLEAVRDMSGVKAVVVVTSDKCYENHETGQAYREEEALGGKDPYSASKACTEIVTASYRYAFFGKQSRTVIATARAGNVFGGGDFSQDRLVPDLMRGFIKGESVLIRSPLSIRPWQHVLEPLSGYLALAEHCAGDLESSHYFGQAWNFGPDERDTHSVKEVADRLVALWGVGAVWHQQGTNPVKEAGVLRLDSSKARKELQWHPQTNIDKGLELTVDWYRRYAQGEDALSITRDQISRYFDRSLA